LGKVEVFPIEGMPEVKEGSDIAELLLTAIDRSRLRLRDRDIVVVNQ
jgi:F420-0:gamma-glutamyl ligase